MKNVKISDAAGNEYDLPESKLQEFKDLDAQIVATYEKQIFGPCQEHIDLCEVWFDKFDRYMI